MHIVVVYWNVERDIKILFCSNYQLVISSGPKEDGFEDSLKYFNVKNYVTTENNLVLSSGDWKQKLLYLAFQVISRIVNKPNVISWWYKKFRANGLLFQQYSDNSSDMPVPSNKKYCLLWEV